MREPSKPLLPTPFQFWFIANHPVEVVDNQIIVEDRGVIHHWGRVKRLKPKETGAVVLPQGAFHAVIKASTPKALILDLAEPLAAALCAPAVTLFSALLKPDAWESLLQKCTELGVNAIQPIISDHTIAKWPDADKKRDRWQKIIHLAAEQSEQRQLPVLHPPCTFKDALSLLDNTTAFIALEHAHSSSLIEAMSSQSAKQYSIFIGPEGGWSAAEVDDCLQKGLIPVTLGPGLLKADTAAVLAVGILKQGK
ncbi:MAG: 16S rRNA (uracil(1498)-N(3))-methyltransferase [Vampirovibrionales bacterium]|nr:16S rRNA (uracil(1498)-N(3))-methyltransferase [Vampirovibrionales bacterium]